MKSAHIKFFASAAMALFFSINVFAQTEREKGLEFYNNRDYTAAIENLEKAVAADDKDNEAWRFLGMAYYAGMKDEEKARAAFEKSKNAAGNRADKDFDSPLKVTKKSPAPYTAKARKKGVSGNVMLLVEFRGDGKIGNIFPYKTLEDGLTENSIDSARKIKFDPAMKNGKGVSVIKFIEYNFSIR